MLVTKTRSSSKASSFTCPANDGREPMSEGRHVEMLAFLLARLDFYTSTFFVRNVDELRTKYHFSRSAYKCGYGNKFGSILRFYISNFLETLVYVFLLPDILKTKPQNASRLWTGGKPGSPFVLLCGPGGVKRELNARRPVGFPLFRRTSRKFPSPKLHTLSCRHQTKEKL